LIHARNVCTVMEAGALVMPASPGFYSRPKTIAELADTVVDRILDQLGLPVDGAFRWEE
jgi:4-hydroxy-3-polyprenylbenzoate decarboxylase